MSGDFRVLIDDAEMRRYLEGLDEKGVIKILRGASTRAGTVLRNAMRPEVPVKARASAGAHGTYGKKGKDYGTPGGMRASVRAARIRRGEVIGVVVAPMGKRAFMRHWIAYGTKRHFIRPRDGTFLRLAFGFAKVVDHPGSKATDYTGRALARGEGNAVDRAEDYIMREATK